MNRHIGLSKYNISMLLKNRSRKVIVIIMKEEVKNNLYDVYCDAYAKASDEVLHGKTLGEVLEVVSDSNTKLVYKFLHYICAYIEKNSELDKKEIQDFVVKNIILHRLFDNATTKE